MKGVDPPPLVEVFRRRLTQIDQRIHNLKYRLRIYAQRRRFTVAALSELREYEDKS